jgi:ABC-2 type transport system permease protein
MISFMFLVMVRVDDPLVPRAIFGVLNTLLFFLPARFIPFEGFRVAALDFHHRSVHLHRARLRNLTVKNTGIEGIYMDVLILTGLLSGDDRGSIALFKRQLHFLTAPQNIRPPRPCVI